jgi:hypothetical protein
VLQRGTFFRLCGSSAKVRLVGLVCLEDERGSDAAVSHDNRGDADAADDRQEKLYSKSA